MKNNELQEFRPVYIQDTGHSSNDEIDMIDFALMVVKRKTLVAVIFSIFLTLGFAVALLTPRVYTFSTTIEIGSQIVDGSIVPFESPEALLAKLQYSHIPQVLAEHKESFPDDNTKYRIKSSAPSGGNLALLEIKGTEDQADTLKNILQVTNQKAIQEHNRIYQSVKRRLEAGLNQATNNIKSSKSSSDNDITITTYQNIIESFTSQLANLQNTRVALPPIRSLDPTGRSRRFIVIASAFAGILLGVFAAFSAEFLLKIKQRMDKDTK